MADAVSDFPSFTQQNDYLYASVWNEAWPETVKVVFEETPLMKSILTRKRMKPQRGGNVIEVPLVYKKNPNVGVIERGGEIEVEDYQPLTNARYEWRYTYASLVRYRTDEQKNQGKYKRLDIVKENVDATRLTLTDMFEEIAFGDGTYNGLTAPNGLQQLITDDGTGTVGGITADTYTWWKNQFVDGGSYVAINNTFLTGLGHLIHLCMKWGAKPKNMYMLCDLATYEKLELNLQLRFQFQAQSGATVGDPTFQRLEFKGIPIYLCHKCRANTLYVIDDTFLKFVYDPGMFMTMDEWITMANNLERVAHIVSAWQLVVSNRRALGVYFDTDEAWEWNQTS